MQVVHSEGAERRSLTWARLSVPYFASGEVNITGAHTIAPGVTIVMGKDATLSVKPTGTLKGEGTKELPIVIRGEDPAPGHWNSVYVMSKNANSFRFTTFRGGGGLKNPFDRKGMVALDPDSGGSAASIRDCFFEGWTDSAIWLSGQWQLRRVWPVRRRRLLLRGEVLPRRRQVSGVRAREQRGLRVERGLQGAVFVRTIELRERVRHEHGPHRHPHLRPDLVRRGMPHRMHQPYVRLERSLRLAMKMSRFQGSMKDRTSSKPASPRRRSHVARGKRPVTCRSWTTLRSIPSRSANT